MKALDKYILNKTSTRQYTRAVWSTYAEIHSRYPPRFIDAGLLEFPVRICACLIKTYHNTHETYLIYPMSMIATSSLDFLLHSCLHVHLRNVLGCLV